MSRLGQILFGLLLVSLLSTCAASHNAELSPPATHAVWQSQRIQVPADGNRLLPFRTISMLAQSMPKTIIQSSEQSALAAPNAGSTAQEQAGSNTDAPVEPPTSSPVIEFQISVTVPTADELGVEIVVPDREKAAVIPVEVVTEGATENATEIAVIVVTVMPAEASVPAAQVTPSPQPTMPPTDQGTDQDTVAQEETAPIPEAQPAMEIQTRMIQGAEVYAQRCAACHGPTGIGRRDFFPTLRGNPFVTVEDPAGIINTVLYGRGLMPRFSPLLSDADIAAVVTYIRGIWGHDAAPVSPEDVRDAR